MPVHHAAVPLFEYSVQVGFPSPAESYKETFDFNELLIENSPGDLCVAYLRAVDIDVGMCDGDLMVVDRSRTLKTTILLSCKLITLHHQALSQNLGWFLSEGRKPLWSLSERRGAVDVFRRV